MILPLRQRELLDHGLRPRAVMLREQLGIQPGETTADSRFTLLPIVCLGACDHAPVMMVDDDLHLDLDPGKDRQDSGALQVMPKETPLTGNMRADGEALGPARFTSTPAGIRALRKALQSMTPQAVIEEVK